MSPAQLANLTGSGLVAACAAVFVTTYWRVAPWRSTPTGWFLMTFAATIGGLGLYTVLITAVGLDGTAASVLRFIRTALLLTVAGLFMQATRMVLRAQRRRTREPGK
ncbi:hypothetical protein K388_05605 [Streptomyces sp. KhCrAH-43]|uniref:putative phage holin n=1 Tax=unclassified Streptomyces TaxID=2593676 RepID=UPI00037C7F24|nr:MULTISPECIES: hypothetical protein [unclassified Streptomyces]MYX67340.1 hypothetical protein [Streptomyces sp. SID8373]RAJ53818.1 hypothetical protein K388_05605 [Streptomyces sp. KhCrAH-43]